MAGERLQLDLRRLEMAYLNENRREYELTKHISLVSLNPLALIALKETGQCELDLPEALFDLDYPGHFMRRIKSVSLTIPCVTGSYTNVNCTLTLLSNKTRIQPIPDNYGEEDERQFVVNFTSLQSIATSSAQNDSGLFELNFRDERYLPFEGAGVISRWRIELSGKWEDLDLPQFDFNTITDVVLHLRYCARNGGDLLRRSAIEHLRDLLSTEGEQSSFSRLFSIRHEFPSEWHHFFHSSATTTRLQLPIAKEQFHFLFRGKTIEVQRLELFLKEEIDESSSNQSSGEPFTIISITAPTTVTTSNDGDPPPPPVVIFPVSTEPGSPTTLALAGEASPIQGLSYGEVPISPVYELPTSASSSTNQDRQNWVITTQGISPEIKSRISDLFVVFHFSVQ
jgi:hypothetical protein